MFAIAVCVLLISVNGIELIMYNSIVARFEWAAAVVLPCPLVILEIVELEIPTGAPIHYLFDKNGEVIKKKNLI